MPVTTTSKTVSKNIGKTKLTKTQKHTVETQPRNLVHVPYDKKRTAPRRSKSADDVSFADSILDDLRQMTATQLKQALGALRVSTAGVVEKEELVQRLYRKSKSADGASIATLASAAASKNKEKKNPRFEPIGPPEVQPLISKRFIPLNKTSVWVYPQGVKNKDIKGAHRGSAAIWAEKNFKLYKHASIEASSKPVEMWTFYDDDPIDIDERVLRNNPNQGTWGYTRNVELRHLKKDDIRRPKDPSLPIRHNDIIIVPPGQKPPVGLQCMGIWVEPSMKRDTSQLDDGAAGFMGVSEEVTPHPDVVYGVGGKWKLLGINDEMERAKAAKGPKGPGINREFEIYIRKLWTGERFGPFTCLPSNRILLIKENVIAKKVKVPIDDQKLSFEGTPLQDKKTLVGSGVRNGDTLDLSRDPAPKKTKKEPSKPKPVFVRDPKTNKKFPVPIDPEDFNLPELKEIVGDRINKSPKKFDLVDDDTDEPVNPKEAPKPGTTLKVKDAPDPTFPVTIKPTSGKPFDVLAKPTDDIGDVKKKVGKRTGLPVDQVRLVDDKGNEPKDTDKPNPKKPYNVVDPNVTVNVPGQGPIPINTKPNDTIGDVKKKLSKPTGFPVRHISLVDPATGKELPDQTKPQPGKTYVLDPPKVTVNVPGMGPIPIPIKPGDTIGDVKKKLSEPTGYPPKNIHLEDPKSGNQLPNKTKPKPGQTFDLDPPKVTVNVPGMDPIPVPIQPDDTIKDVKKKLTEPTGYPDKDIHLVDPESGNEVPDKAKPQPGETLDMDIPKVTVNVPRKDPSGKNPSVKSPVGKDPSGKNPSDKSPSGKDPSGKNPRGKSPVRKDPWGKSPFSKDPANPASNNPTNKNPNTNKPATKTPADVDPIDIKLEPNDTIADIKRKLSKPSGYPVKHIRLMDPSGKELPDLTKPGPGETYDLDPPKVDVQLPNGKGPKGKGRTKLPLLPKQTIGDLKDILEDETGIPKDKQQLFVPDSDKPLPNDADVLKRGIQPGSKLEMKEIPEITVKTPNGRTFCFIIDPEENPLEDPKNGRFRLTPTDTIGDLKDILEDATGVPKDKQHVFLPDSDKPLSDHTKLPKSGIEPGSKLEMKEIPEIAVKTPNGRTFCFLVDPEDSPMGTPKKDRHRLTPSNTIGDLKDMLEDLTGVPKDRQQIFTPNKDRTLPDKTKIPKKGLKPGSKLEMKEIPEITVKTPSGRTFCLLVDPESQPQEDPRKGPCRLTPDATISDLKDVVEELEGIPKSRMRAFVMDPHDKELKDKTRLGKTGLNGPGTIEMKEIPEITVKAPNGRTFCLTIDPEANPSENGKRGKYSLTPTDKIGDLKDLVEKIAGIPKSKMRAFIVTPDDEELLDDETPFKATRLGLDGTIEMKLRDPLDIPIKYDGRTFHVIVDPDDTVATLKRKAKKMGIPIDQLRLRDLDGEEMIDEEPLDKYNLRNGQLIPELPEIEIALPNGVKIPLSVLPTKTMGEIKDVIEEKTGITKVQQRLFFLDYELDDDQPFSRTKVKHGDVLKLNVEPAEPDNVVTFKTKDGRTFILDIELEDTVKDVRRKLSKKVGFPIGNVRLGDLTFDEEDAIFLDLHPGIRTSTLVIDPPEVEIEIPGINRHVRLGILPTMTMRDVKKLIEEQVPSYKAKKQSRMFFLDNDEGIDDDTPLARLKLENGMKLEIRDFEIQVVSYNGGSAILEVRTTEYIDDVKQKIKNALGVPVDQQNLAFRGQPIPEDLTLKEIGLGHNDIIKLEAMQITIIMPNRKEYLFKVELEDTIGSLKHQICRKKRTRIAVQCIMSGSTELQNDQTLKECNVRHRDTLKMELFQVSVMDWEQQTCVLEDLCPSDQVAKLRRKILDAKNLSVSMQKLVHDRQLVPDKGSLEAIGIKHKTVLVLQDPYNVDLDLPDSDQVTVGVSKVKKFGNNVKDIWPVVPDWSKRIFFFDNDESIGDGNIEVTVMHWEGYHFKVRGVQLGKKLETLKRRICGAEGIPVKKQQLAFNGELLDKNRTLRQQGVKHNSILVLQGKREANFEMTNSQKISLSALPTRIQASFEVIVRHWSKNEYMVRCGPTDYLDDLKITIEEQIFLPVDHQQLTFRGKEIDETENLKSQGIAHGSVLMLEQMEISVETPQGKKLKLKVDLDDTIIRVKKMVQKKHGTPIKAQCIMFGGEELPDDKTLQECEVDRDDVLTLQEFSLKVMHWSGQVFTLSGVLPTDSVQALKTKIYRAKSVPTKKQVIKFEDNILTDNKILKDEGIRHRSVLIMEEGTA